MVENREVQVKRFEFVALLELSADLVTVVRVVASVVDCFELGEVPEAV